MDAAIKDYYKILGVKPDATEEEIRGRWLELVKHHHPDLELADKVDERIKAINEAYQVLKQPLARWEYDLQRTCERELGKSSMRRWAPLCGFLILILVAGGLYLLLTDIPSELNSELNFRSTATVPQVPEEKVSQPLTSEATKEEGVANADEKIAKVVKPLAPPVGVEKGAKVQEATVSVGLKNSRPGLSKTEGVPPKPVPVESTKKIRIEQPGRDKELVSSKNKLDKTVSSNSTTEMKPQPTETKLADHSKPPLIASEEEVRTFFNNYTKVYNQKDIGGFLSFFSPQAVQNQTDKYEEIKRIYTRFFRQSSELSYRIGELKIEVYENGAEAGAQYQVDQVLRAGGERKSWNGSIRWVLGKENGALRIISLDYQNQKSP